MVKKAKQETICRSELLEQIEWVKNNVDKVPVGILNSLIFLDERRNPKSSEYIVEMSKEEYKKWINLNT